MYSPPVAAKAGPSGEVALAVKNAAILGASLVVTWSVALLGRLLLPRHLGPERFGAFSFADSLAATLFILLGLGAETYIQKEIPVRPRHASDFFGGLVVARLCLALALFIAMGLMVAHRPSTVQRAAFAFGAAQLLVVLNSNLAALLHAAGTVRGLALVNVGAKALWGGIIAGGILTEAGIDRLALALFFSEAVRAVVLARLARRHLSLTLTFDAVAARQVVKASLPFYVSQVATTVYAKVDVTLLSALATDTEVGWYSAASNIAGLSFLISPLIGWVLLPLLSRAAARSLDEMFAILRWTVRMIVVLVLPLTVLVGVGADVWVRELFGPSYGPAALSLRILAPMLVLTYLAMISGTCLIMLSRPWTVTIISLAGLVLNPALNTVLVPWSARTLGAGGAGVGAAIALVTTELVVTVTMFFAIGKAVLDRAGVVTIVKAIGCAAAVVIAHRILHFLGGFRLAVDIALYLVLLVATGVARPDELKRIVELFSRRGGQRATQ
jgi:O-antigen/teichoic acid export membrane protein